MTQPTVTDEIEIAAAAALFRMMRGRAPINDEEAQWALPHARCALTAVAPLIAAAERERCVHWHDVKALGHRRTASEAKQKTAESYGAALQLAAWHEESARALREENEP